MGLDQSIFTNNYLLARHIYSGRTLGGQTWSNAFLAPRNIDGHDTWTDFDRYSKAIQASMDLVDMPDLISTLSVKHPEANTTPGDGDGIIPILDRWVSLDVIRKLCFYGTKLDGEPFFQIGLFFEFNALHGWFQRHSPSEVCLGNDRLVPFGSAILTEIQKDAELVLQAYECGSEQGEKLAQELFPTRLEDPLFGNAEYGDAFLRNVEDLRAFACSILQHQARFPGTRDATFYYAPGGERVIQTASIRTMRGRKEQAR